MFQIPDCSWNQTNYQSTINQLLIKSDGFVTIPTMGKNSFFFYLKIL